MKVAIVHYWLVGMRGGEKVVEALCEMFPEADVFTHVYDPTKISETIRRHDVRTTFIQKLPRAKHWYRRYLPLMPIALEQLDLSGYDLVISSESGPAKGLLVPAGALHVCYCHTPMRYVWDMYHQYLRDAGFFTRLFMVPGIHYVRQWDALSSARVDYFIANSANVATRIRRHYRRDAEVIPPPVDTAEFAPAAERGDFYLMVGQLVRYKRVDIAIDAFNRLGRRLVIIGDGEESRALSRRAGDNIEMMGWQPAEVLADHYARCRALIFPGEEDFGIVPIEAMASGRPVIAYRKGGALETVVEGTTGLFFDEQTPESLIDAVERYETQTAEFDPEAIADHARSFDRSVFKRRMRETIDRLLSERPGRAEERPVEEA